MERNDEKTSIQNSLKLSGNKPAEEDDTETFQTLKMFKKGLDGARLPN